jgi:arginine repressor
VDEKVGFRSVYSTFDKGVIALIKSLLGSNGIVHYIDNENAASLVAGQVSGYMTVMVAKNQVDLAKELLKEIQG